MSTTDDWITNRITQAKNGHDLLTSLVVTRMNKLLRDRLTNEPLTQSELTAAAKQLIADMIPISPEPDAK